MQKQKLVHEGFTLIELLVVISIIGLLASIILVSLNGAEAKARDAKRAADRKQIETAMSLYYSDNNTWPPDNGTWTCFGAPSTESCWLANYTGSDALVTAMQPYMNSSPTTNAHSGNDAYNRYLYIRSVGVNGIANGSLAGAYLIWPKEQTMSASECQSIRAPEHYDAYWYCYEFVGAP